MKGALAEILIEQKRFAEAELLLNEGLELARKNAIDPRYREYQLLLRRMVALYERWGKPESAEPFRRLMAHP